VNGEQSIKPEQAREGRGWYLEDGLGQEDIFHDPTYEITEASGEGDVQ